MDEDDDDNNNNNNESLSFSKDKEEKNKEDDCKNSEQNVEEHKSEQGDDMNRGNEEASNKTSNINEQGDSNEDEGDRKPAARRMTSEDDSSDSSNSSGSDSDTDSDDENKDDDESNGGRALSDYEKLRLERIRRNREYLSQLGLEGSMPKKQAPASRKKRKEQQQQQQPTAPQRSSSRSRKTVNYTEPSVAQLLRDSILPAATTSAPPTAAAAAADTAKPKKERKPRGTSTKLMHRMERFIYNEFNSIRAHKKRILKDAERAVRLAEKEVAYWTKRASIWEKQQERQRAVAAAKQAAEQERADLGGTVRQLMQDIDRRMPELLAAASEYDEVFEAGTRAREREAKRLENEHRMKLLDAFDRFPKAMKTATSLLNAVLLERAPKDPPPPRRSKRASLPEDQTSPAPTPKKKGRKKKTTEVSDENTAWPDGNESSAASPVNAEADGAESSSPDKEQQQQDQGATKRRRIARNVGGWISPNFAEVLDRSWLEKDASTEKFDPSSFVPQVGDTVLYYPAGHRAYLDKYPDLLGKKTRSVSRVPLWERAAAEKDDLTAEEGTVEKTTSSWWNEEWLTGVVEGDLGNYPIVCRVERTHAEYPPDPYGKSVKKDESGNIIKITWKPPKDPGVLKQIAGTPLRLAVGLRPLTPILPPKWSDDSGPQNDETLVLPPSFTVVTFPSDLTPFLVPFAWAYDAAHVYKVDQMAVSAKDGKVRVCEITSIGDSCGSMRLDDKLPFVRSLVKRADANAQSQVGVGFSEDLSKYQHKFSSRDAQVVIAVLKRFLEENVKLEDQSGPQASINVVDFVRSTLPLWNSVVAMPSAYNRKRLLFSPWELSPLPKSGSQSIVIQPKVLDAGLREKVDLLIETLVKEEESAGIFLSPVTDEIAPSYSCAVPLGMSLSKILSRLRSSRGALQCQCYYRGVDSLLADVSSILDNCLLYNSPDSPVVESAVDIVTKLKDSISKISQVHYRELADARKIDEERRQQVLRQLAPTTSGGATEDIEASRQAVITTLKVPHKDPLDREWLLQSIRGGSDFMEPLWVPQSGDEILYSRQRHERFVKTHYPSLEADQCTVLNDPSKTESTEESEAPTNDWIQATVQWTRPAFPKALSKRSDDDENTFRTSAVLLAICLKLSDSDNTCVIYWRPCVLPSDCKSCEDSACLCGLSRRETFLQALEDNRSCSSTAPAPERLDESRLDQIDLVFSLLKRRCLREISPSFVPDELSKASIKVGYKPPSAKPGLRNLPKFEHLFDPSSDAPSNTSAMKTRKTPKKKKKSDPAQDRLSETGFLPEWTHGSYPDIAKELQDCETVMALPHLSIELIQMRLRNGYYRNVAAIENDLIESYVSTAVLHLRGAASRKKASVSVKRIARSMASSKVGTNSSKDESGEAVALSATFEEENTLTEHLRHIRELYATALVAASDTVYISHLFGLNEPVERLVEKIDAKNPDQDPTRAAARQKLSYLLAAVGKDQLQNTFQTSAMTLDSVPTAQVQVRCSGDIVTYMTTVKRIDSKVAEWKGKEVKVKIRCDGKAFVHDKPVDPSEALEGDDNILQIPLSSISIEESDFEGNEKLVRFFFGRPGRMELCARCKAYGRSLLTCRVRRAHSNIDFDWISVFKGVGGVDGLLRALHPEGMRSLQTDENDRQVEEKNASGNENDVDKDDDDVDPSGARDDDGGDNDEEEEETLDPSAFLENAEEALEQARNIQEEAVRYMDAPTRLGEEFIQNNFPIDESDGHFVYCVICGISGDLLCCDGCPNVVHNHCIGVEEVPDGDWFCEECELNGKHMKEKAKQATNASDQGNKLPFGRLYFDEKKASDLLTKIQNLQESRPERQRRKEENTEAGDGDDSDASSEVSQDESASLSQSRFADPFDALSSVTKRFLTSIGIRTGEEFLAARTTDIASDFVKWRIKKRKPKLKGTGAIASVSGWKALCRKAAREMESESQAEKARGRPRKVRPVDETDENFNLKRSKGKRRRAEFDAESEEGIYEPSKKLHVQNSEFVASSPTRNGMRNSVRTSRKRSSHEAGLQDVGSISNSRHTKSKKQRNGTHNAVEAKKGRKCRSLSPAKASTGGNTPKSFRGRISLSANRSLGKSARASSPYRSPSKTKTPKLGIYASAFVEDLTIESVETPPEYVSRRGRESRPPDRFSDRPR